MFNFLLILLLKLVFIEFSFASPCNTGTLTVIYKGDGSRQCQPQSGISLENMVKKITQLNITICNQEKRASCYIYLQSCNRPTGQLNTYRIPFSDWNENQEALKRIGFNLWENLCKDCFPGNPRSLSACINQ